MYYIIYTMNDILIGQDEEWEKAQIYAAPKTLGNPSQNFQTDSVYSIL